MLHLEYGSTQSMVVLITDIIVPRGFLLIQARALVSWWQPHLGPFTDLSVNAHRVSRPESCRMEAETAGRGRRGQTRLPDTGLRILNILAYFSLWVHGFPRQGDIRETPPT